MPHHLLLSAVEHTLLFRDHVEAGALWVRLRERLPEARAVCLMPDHVHVLHGRDVRRRLGDAANAYAQWRNARRGERGRVFEHLPPTEEVGAGQKARRHVRYIHLNPCRAGLVTDPLAWAWSTHRDAVGLALPPWRRRVPDPLAFHRYVSGDPTVHVRGTELPGLTLALPGGERGFRAVQAAVSELLRVPWSEVTRRGPARRLVVSATVELGALSISEVARLAGVTPRAVRQASVGSDPRVAQVAQVVGDARFPGLVVQDLRWQSGWRRYMRRRGIARGPRG